MAAEWHYTQNGNKAGPVTASQLKAMAKNGELTPDDMIWKQGMASWKNAGTVKGLFPVRADVEPPALPFTTPPVPSSGLASLAPREPAPAPDASHFKTLGSMIPGNPIVTLAVGMLVAIILMAILPVLIGSSRDPYSRQSLAAESAASACLFVALCLAIALGCVIYEKRPGRKQIPVWIELWQIKPVFFGLGFILSLPLVFFARGLPGAINGATLITALFLGLCIFCSFGLFVALCIYVGLFLFKKVALLGVNLAGTWIPESPDDSPLTFCVAGFGSSSTSLSIGKSFVGTFRLHPDRRLDVIEGHSVVKSWIIVKLEPNSELVLKDENGTLKRYKAKYPLGELGKSVAKLFETSRLDLLQGKWEQVDGNGPAVQFTKDGGFIRFDGFAARYSLDGSAPNEVVTIQVSDNERVALKVLSLEQDEMVLAGDGGSCHYRRGVSISDAEAKRRADEFSKQLKAVGNAALSTLAVVGAGIAILGVAAAASGGSGTQGEGAKMVACHVCDQSGKRSFSNDPCPACFGRGWRLE